MLKNRLFLPASVAALAAAVAACSGAPAGPSASPAPDATASPAPQGIEHATGSRDLLLRVETGGGFVAPGFLMTQAPYFSLYGDGTVVFRDPAAENPPLEGSIGRFAPFRTAKLTEEEVQELLRFAIAQGGLGLARADYGSDMIADAPTTVFMLRAGGLDKRVAVYALGIDDASSPDAAARVAFETLAERLRTFGQGGSVTATTYEPERYRGVLVDPFGPVGEPQSWPWKELVLADFAPGQGPDAIEFPHRTLSADDVAALGLTGLEGGAQGIFLRGPDGTGTHGLTVRPLLPDEAE